MHSLVSLFLSLCALAAALPSTTWAEPLVPSGKCAIVVASRQSIPEVSEYSQAMDIVGKVTVYQAVNGWLAISVGSVELEQSKSILTDLKSQAELPPYADC